MCGLVGFFVGCDLKVSCPLHKARAKMPATRSAFSNWNAEASVRSGPNRAAEVKQPLFPISLVPILRHPELKGAENDTVDFLRRASLLRFLNFTHKLELMVVNTVTANIAFGRYDLDLSEQMRLDAHRIYTDEAYHALFSYEMMLATTQSTSSRLVEGNATPGFLSRFEKLLMDRTAQEKRLLELCFVIVSEMLITSTLNDARKHEGMDTALQGMLEDHAKDEARHHTYYRDILVILLQSISDKNRCLVLKIIPQLLLAYTSPDIKAMKWELQQVGISVARSAEITDDIYSEATIVQYAQKCGVRLEAAIQSLIPSEDRSLVEDGFRSIKYQASDQDHICLTKSASSII